MFRACRSQRRLPPAQDAKLAREMQALFASPYLRVNTTTDVTGVEICGALKNVLALAAGIVEGLDLGNNAMAALVAQGCSEIRWLAEKMGARPATISGLSGLGDIMLTCYGSLSRNRRACLPACLPRRALRSLADRVHVCFQCWGHLSACHAAGRMICCPLDASAACAVAMQVGGRAPGQGGGPVRHPGQQQPGCGGSGDCWRGGGPGAHLPRVPARAHRRRSGVVKCWCGSISLSLIFVSGI